MNTAPNTLHTENGKRGFTLLIAIIFMSVMLSFGLTLGSLGYKQEVLASNAIESQYAFYAADSALECALYYAQQANLFAYNADTNQPIPSFPCDNTSPYLNPTRSYAGSGSTAVEILGYRFQLDARTPNPRCADVTVYSYQSPQAGNNNITTYIFSQGYDVACSSVGGSRFVSRGISAHY
ncbi:MAG TPA: hypothetical protein PLW99_00035 [Candidatus Paceibacterota bacterium]|nr:MAG: hypothetical protein B7X03_01900 [Parcubacteria group bacterium 21-58-10]OYV83175.1 MAG: hypothetical protein B7W96_00475 [Parcubacteria group bacterium 37-58-5]HQT82534.1 hypothetical protein [Candidatus Paceibacterota bacterium]